MNVYDFDGTIYDGDSTTDFVVRCYFKHPSCFVALPKTIVYAIGFAFGIVKKDGFKQAMYSFLKHVPDCEKEVEEFWKSYRRKIGEWYINQMTETDLIISASPSFLLNPIAKELGVTLIASEVDVKSGKLLGPNNSGKEKVKRLNEFSDKVVIENFYSDSNVDLPLARLAKKAYKVKHGIVKEWY